MRIADVNGSSTTDVMWGTARDYQFLDFTGGIQPRLLVAVQNGMGKTSEIAYRPSTAYAADGREAGDPWTTFAPFPMQVVASSTVTDGLGASYVTEYSYRNAFYDGWEAEFRGFGEAQAKTLGDANSPTTVSTTTFEPGLMPDWACADLADGSYRRGLLNPTCRFRENPLEALKGAVTYSTTCDESGSICQGVGTTVFNVKKLYQPAGSDRSVWFAYPSYTTGLVYDTSVVPSGEADVPGGGYHILDLDGEGEGDGTWTIPRKSFSGSGHVYTLSSWTAVVDAWGNVTKSVNYGATELTGDEVTTHAVFDEALIHDLYIHRVRESWTNAAYGVDPADDADDPAKLGRTIITYPASGPCRHLPSKVEVAGSSAYAWDNFPARVGGDPPTFRYVRSSARYGRFCQPNQTCTGAECGAATGILGQAWVTYDDEYAVFPVRETIDVSHPGHDGPQPAIRADGTGSVLSTSATWYAEYGAIHTATDPSGLTTSVALDNLGRPVRMYGPGCAEPKAAIEYHLGSPLSYVHTVTNEGECGEGGTDESGGIGAGMGAVMQAFAWVDGMGRARGAVSEGSSTDGLSGGNWIRSGIQTFDAKGAVQRAYLPNAIVFSVASPGSFSLAPDPTTLYARSAYDAFGRVTRAWTTDGTAVVATRYGALVTDIWDAGDLAPGIYSGTPATTYVDGLGRTVRTVERNRSEGSTALETFATNLRYNSIGAVVEMQRGAVSGAERDSSFVGNEFVLKLQDYDTLGRRIVNHDPDAGDYRYAYDAIDRLVSTRDARGVINRYWYDRGGRLVAEDLGGEVEYSATGWTAAGGADGVTCLLDVHDLPVLPLPGGGCFDVLYGFDEEFDPPAEAWTTEWLPGPGASCAGHPAQGPLAGRPSWTRDRSGTVVLGYDCHGWAVWSVRQVNPDTSVGYPSWSTFDEAQRLLTEKHPDGSMFDFAYTSRGLLHDVQFEENVPDPDGSGTIRASRPLIRETRYDAQGRRVFVEYGDRLCTLDSDPDDTCDPASPPPAPDSCDCDEDGGTEESYTYDARQRLARKQAVRSDGLVVLDYRYTYDVASNIVRIDDDRRPASGASRATEGSRGADPRLPDGFVPYDIEYSYDALNRLTRATPLYAVPQPHRVQEQTWSFDSLGSMLEWDDVTGHFYAWSLGQITNGLELTQRGDGDPGVGPLPRVGGVPVDLLGRPVAARAGPAPHALYEATARGADPDTLRAYYDAAGNMMALVVHRPDGCGREDTPGTGDVAAGGPDGAGCREGPDFRLMFAWDEVGNLLAVERQTLFDTTAETCGAPGGAWPVLDEDDEEYFGPGEEAGRATHAWCPTARVDNTYDFGGQRRLKYEENITDDTGRIPELGSLYISASFEKREGELNETTWVFDEGLTARYLWNEAGILFELDAPRGDGLPPGGAEMPRTRLTLTNQIGSASTILDADTGAAAEILSQLPYGAEEQTYPRVEDMDDPTAFAPRYEFTGKERDRGVGLVYFGARSLDPRLARWVSVDPATLHAGVVSGQFNPYSFLLGRPLANRDAFGLWDFLDSIIEGVEAAAEAVNEYVVEPINENVVQPVNDALHTAGTAVIDAAEAAYDGGAAAVNAYVQHWGAVNENGLVEGMYRTFTDFPASTGAATVAGSQAVANYYGYELTDTGEQIAYTTGYVAGGVAQGLAEGYATSIAFEAAGSQMVGSAARAASTEPTNPAPGPRPATAPGAAAATSSTTQEAATATTARTGAGAATSPAPATPAASAGVETPSGCFLEGSPQASYARAETAPRAHYEPPAVTGTASAGRYIQPDRSATDVLQQSQHPGLDAFSSTTHTHPARIDVNPSNPSLGSTRLQDPRPVTGAEVDNIMNGTATRAGSRGHS